MKEINTKFKSYEELLFNIENYHNTQITDSIRDWAKRMAGQPILLKFEGEKASQLPLSGNCTLPVFREVERPWKCVCVHIAEID